MKAEMEKAGWQNNGIYWWFEDSGQMCFRDALDLFKASAPRHEDDGVGK